MRSGKISYTSCRDTLRDTLSQLGYNPNDYGLHGLRSGGITSAVRNTNSILEKYMVDGNPILPRIFMLKKALKTGYK